MTMTQRDTDALPSVRACVTALPEQLLSPPYEMRSEMNWIDFSGTANPLGTPPSFIRAMETALAAGELNYPPDREAHALRSVLARKFGLSVESFLVGSTVGDMVRAVAQTYQPCTVGVAVPGPVEYALAAGNAGHRVVEIADIVLMRSDLLDVPVSIQLSRATLRNIKQNLFWALVYNAVCIPVAAGALSFMGLNLNPMIAAAAMSLSSVCVVTNALRLRGWKPDNPNEKESTMEKTLNVEGMMCQHCVAHVKRALEGVEGVEEAVVDLDAGTATAKLAHDVPEDVLAAAIVEAGYEVK